MLLALVYNILCDCFQLMSEMGHIPSTTAAAVSSSTLLMIMTMPQSSKVNSTTSRSQRTDPKTRCLLWLLLTEILKIMQGSHIPSQVGHSQKSLVNSAKYLFQSEFICLVNFTKHLFQLECSVNSQKNLFQSKHLVNSAKNVFYSECYYCVEKLQLSG